MAKVYISSTYVDLKKEREAAAQAIRRLEHQAIAMENYVASDKRPVDKCLQDVRTSDAYVGIFALRYGFIPDGYHKSITHLEYEAAQKAGIPCLIFLLDDNAQWPVKYVTTGEERYKINKLRDELKKQHIVSFFNNPDQLGGLVSAAVGNLILVSERSFIKFKRPEELIGTQLGKYVILEKLGRGGKGVVFKVMDKLEDREKAIKMVPPRIADSPVAFKELKREVNTAACIIHPNVVKVLGLEEVDGQFFIVMEYIEGKSLEQILADSIDGKLEEQRVIDIMKKLARGLLETHKKNVVHRDIKPSNVMVTPDGQVKILDFGISYQVTTSMTDLVGEHHSTGTWPYMAPEQLSTRYGRENKQVDIWGFAVTMYQLLTGKFPFVNKDQIKDRNEKPYEMEGVSRKTRNIVMKCLEKDRKKRFQNMEEVWNAISKITTEPREKNLRKWSLLAISIIVLIVAYFIIPPLLQKEKVIPVVKIKTEERLEQAKINEKKIKLSEIPEKVKYVISKGIKVDKNEKDLWEADYGDRIIMVYIPSGEFTMGSEDYDDEKPPHEVNLGGYWMGKTEVTVKQFSLFVKDKGYVTEAESSGGAYTWTGEKWEKKEGINWKNPGFKQKDNHPVVCVSWNDAVEYCKWLSVKKGFSFKLPTEAQWEKAARGTDKRKYPWGNPAPSGERVNFADKQAWLKAKISWADKDIDDGYAYTAPVGSYPDGASSNGLLDMAGNVWEWCSDWYGSDYYKNAPKKNPPGPKSGTYRVLRGGSWDSKAVNLRCAYRDYGDPSDRSVNVGFRLCQDI